MKIAHVVSAFPDRVTGPRNSVTLLSKYLNMFPGVESDVFSDVSVGDFVFNDVLVQPSSMLCVGNYDAVVFSGIYNRTNVALSRECRRLSVPYLISPRSSLVRTSLQKSWWKKFFFLFCYGRTYLKGCAALHFLTEKERDHSYYGKRKSIVAGNIVNVMPGKQTKKKIIGFLGRYDIGHKGLDVLMEGAGLARESLLEKGWALYMHGPDFKRGREQLERMLVKYNLEDVVVVGDALHGEEKHKFLDSISVFVHTSRYEGQPQAVMEAMRRGCAIMVTEGTNMGDIVRSANCGGVVLCDADSIALFFRTLPSDHADLSLMQKNAREYSEKNFNGEFVARNFFNQLLKVLDNGRAEI